MRLERSFSLENILWYTQGSAIATCVSELRVKVGLVRFFCVCKYPMKSVKAILQKRLAEKEIQIRVWSREANEFLDCNVQYLSLRRKKKSTSVQDRTNRVKALSSTKASLDLVRRHGKYET